jgi:hypothetical protein
MRPGEGVYYQRASDEPIVCGRMPGSDYSRRLMYTFQEQQGTNHADAESCSLKHMHTSGAIDVHSKRPSAPSLSNKQLSLTYAFNHYHDTNLTAKASSHYNLALKHHIHLIHYQ